MLREHFISVAVVAVAFAVISAGASLALFLKGDIDLSNQAVVGLLLTLLFDTAIILFFAAVFFSWAGKLSPELKNQSHE